MLAGIESRCNAITESGERFGFEISLTLPAIAYRLCVSSNVPHQLFTIAVWVCKEFLAERHRHFKVDGIFVLVGIFFLQNNSGNNATNKVLHSHCRPYLLLYVVISLAMKIHEIHCVLCASVG